MLRVRTHRVATLRPKDYDHEIDLVDRDGTSSYAAPTPEMTDMSRMSTTAELLQNQHGSETDDGPAPPESPQGGRDLDGTPTRERPPEDLQHERELPHDALRPSIEIQRKPILPSDSLVVAPR